MASSRQFVVNTVNYFCHKPPSLNVREEICRGACGSVHFGELDSRSLFRGSIACFWRQLEDKATLSR